MAVLVLAEVQNGILQEHIRQVMSAAKQLGDEIDLLVNVDSEEQLNTVLKLDGVRKIIYVPSFARETASVEQVTATLSDVILSGTLSYRHIVACSSSYSKDLMPRLAALCDSQPITDVIGVKTAHQFVRPIYAGNAIAEVESTDKRIFLTVRATAFKPASDQSEANTVEKLELSLVETTHSNFVDATVSSSERPELTSARVVVSGGRGLGSAENFQKIESLADKLDGAVGASRAAVDAGFISNDFQVGQTGKIVAPDLYLAIGISGAIQHIAGMKDSGVIVAINQDEDAPIFKFADYCWKTDLFTAIDELNALL